MQSREGLERFVQDFNAGPAPTGFSSRAIRLSMGVGLAISTLVTWSLIGWVVQHLLRHH